MNNVEIRLESLQDESRDNFYDRLEYQWLCLIACIQKTERSFPGEFSDLLDQSKNELNKIRYIRKKYDGANKISERMNA